MDELINDTPGRGKRDDEGRVANGRVERMPIACFTDSWFHGKWDYADNQTVYWLVADGVAKAPAVESVERRSLTPGFFSMSGSMSSTFSTRKRIPGEIASDLNGASLARWVAGAFDERKRLGYETTWEECAPFDERDWLALLDTPAIERWNRKRLTGTAGNRPTFAERARAMARLAHGVKHYNGVTAATVLLGGDVWDDGFWEAKRAELDHRFGVGWSFFERREDTGALRDFLVITGAGDAFELLSTTAPAIILEGWAHFARFVIGEPEPLPPEAIEHINLDDDWRNETRYLR